MDREQFYAVMKTLKAESIQDLEALTVTIADFPHGQDAFLERAWIINAIDCGSYETVQWMISKNVELSFRDEEGLTPFHSCLYSISPDKYEILSLLIESGGNINIRGMNDYTPLHLAAVLNDEKAMDILLKAGADQTIKTRIDSYATPEQEAKIMGKNKAAHYLANYGKT